MGGVPGPWLPGALRGLGVVPVLRLRRRQERTPPPGAGGAPAGQGGA